MTINSRSKGARGERELAHEFQRVFNCSPSKTYRGVQHSGGPDSPDIVSDIEWLHPECKRVESLRLWPAMEQAIRDAGESKIPAVFHRSNKKKSWIMIIRMDDIPSFCRKMCAFLDGKDETDGNNEESRETTD